MQKIKLFITTVLLCPVIALGQTQSKEEIEAVPYPYAQKKSNMVLYFAFGGKQINANNSFFGSASNPNIGGSVGAGSYWNKNRIIIGTEFFHTSGQKNNASFKALSHSFNSEIFFAYRLVQKNGLHVAPHIGIASMNNTIHLSSRSSTAGVLSSVVHTQSVIGLNTALGVEKFNKKGFFMGVKFGYNTSINGNQKWVNQGADYKTDFADNPGGFFILITTGGLIKF